MKIGGCIAVMVLAFACTQKAEQPGATYTSYLAWYDEHADARIQVCKEKFKTLSKPEFPAEQVWHGEWLFMPGSTDETLHVVCKAVTGDQVSLPHRVNTANRALWYSKRIRVDEPGILRVSADDGAQVFINSQPVKRLQGDFFSIPEAGDYVVTIRVLNNAMAGGLRHVAFCASRDFSNYVQAATTVKRLQNLVEKLALHTHVSQTFIEAVESALANPSVETVQFAEGVFSQYPMLVGPWLTRSQDSIFINVWTDENNSVELRYGNTVSTLSNRMIQQGQFHRFKIPWQKHKSFHYQLQSQRTTTTVFTNRNSADEFFSFAIWADSQSGWPVFQQLIRQASLVDDAFGIGIGDLVGNGSDSTEWRHFHSIISAAASARPDYLIAGNHDYDGFYDDLIPEQYRRFQQTNPTSYRSWSHANCAFIALDPNERFPIGIPEGSAQYEWFHQQLTMPFWKDATWRFILIHQPPYSQGWPGYEGDQVIRDLLDPVIETAKIDFVVSGHTHDYERLTKKYGEHNTTFLIVGGAGGSLEPEASSPQPKMDTVIKRHHMGRFFINGSSLRFEVRDVDDHCIDFFKRKK